MISKRLIKITFQGFINNNQGSSSQTIKPVAQTNYSNPLPTRQPIVKAEKTFYKGALFGHISNGGGVVELSDGFAIKFVSINDKFVILQLLDYGKNVAVRQQTWQKAKIVKETKQQPKPAANISVSDNIEQKSIFDLN